MNSTLQPQQPDDVRALQHVKTNTNDDEKHGQQAKLKRDISEAPITEG